MSVDPNLIVVGHPLIQHKLTLMRQTETPSALFRQLLREISRHQVGLLAECFDNLDADPRIITRDRSVPLERIGGFLTLDSQNAGAICRLQRPI